MSFSEEWDQRFKDDTHLSIWPWSDLVSTVMRFSPPKKDEFNVLELGCGAGANIPFFRSFSNVNYHAIEGSKNIVDRLKSKFPDLKDRIVCGDFTQNIPFDKNFDLIVDRGAITHNTIPGITNTLNQIYQKLVDKGKLISISLYSTMSSDYKRGEETDDKYTRKNFSQGTFTNVGRVHFFDKPHILKLFEKFHIIFLEHEISNQEIPEENTIASWNLVVEKI